MKYLIDTHVFLWILFDDDKLPGKVRNILTDFDNDIYVSIITYWEISLKYSLGKLELRGIRPEQLPQYAKEIGVATLGISEEDTSSFYKLPRIKYKDPFDRLIIWQAIKRNLILLSKDKAFKDYKEFGLKTLWE